MYDQEKYRLGTDDYLSAFMDCSKKLRRNIDIYIMISLKVSIANYRWLHIHLISYKNTFYQFFFSIKMGKTEVENLDLKSKLNIVSGIIANAKKDLESLKTEINNVKSDCAMSKKGLNSLNNEFSECLKDSLKVTDNLIKIDNDILMTKN